MLEHNEISDDYRDYTYWAWRSLHPFAGPITDDRFWSLVDAVNWPVDSSEPFELLAGRVAQSVTLRESSWVFLRALDCTDELREAMDDAGIRISSEDCTDDFLYHLVGLGRDAVERFLDDPERARPIADQGLYVESFRYVLEATRCWFPSADYVEAFREIGMLDSPDSEPRQGAMRFLDGDLPAIVIRVDAATLHAVTPTGYVDVARPS